MPTMYSQYRSPGPWVARPDGSVQTTTPGIQGNITPPGSTDSEIRANQALLCATPDLLARLAESQRLLRNYQSQCLDSGLRLQAEAIGRHMAMNKDALDKAGGWNEGGPNFSPPAHLGTAGWQGDYAAPHADAELEPCESRNHTIHARAVGCGVSVCGVECYTIPTTTSLEEVHCGRCRVILEKRQDPHGPDGGPVT